MGIFIRVQSLNLTLLSALIICQGWIVSAAPSYPGFVLMTCFSRSIQDQDDVHRQQITNLHIRGSADKADQQGGSQ